MPATTRASLGDNQSSSELYFMFTKNQVANCGGGGKLTSIRHSEVHKPLAFGSQKPKHFQYFSLQDNEKIGNIGGEENVKTENDELSQVREMVAVAVQTEKEKEEKGVQKVCLMDQETQTRPEVDQVSQVGTPLIENLLDFDTYNNPSFKTSNYSETDS